MQDDKFAELVLQELRMMRHEIGEMRKEHGAEIDSMKKDVNSLKTKFMLVAVTMGVAGSKLSDFLPFLK
jgi:hypothetical protein